MKLNEQIMEALMSFCVCTACITILEAILGMLFFPDAVLGYSAFFSPPIYGAISILLSIVTISKKELSVKQVLFRQGIHFIFFEVIVLGINYVEGNLISLGFTIILALGIAIVFVTVYFIIWLNDCKSADLFNQKLKEYQAREEMEG